MIEEKIALAISRRAKCPVDSLSGMVAQAKVPSFTPRKRDTQFVYLFCFYTIDIGLERLGVTLRDFREENQFVFSPNLILYQPLFNFCLYNKAKLKKQVREQDRQPKSNLSLSQRRIA